MQTKQILNLKLDHLDGFRAKLRKDVSLQERSVRGLSRNIQKTKDILNRKYMHQRKHHKTEKLIYSRQR